MSGRMIGLVCASAGAAAILDIAASYICFRKALCVKREKTLDARREPGGAVTEAQRKAVRALVDKALTLPYEDVYIKSFDGLRLHARYYETSPDAPVHIMFHGYRSAALRDFCGGLQEALAAGRNALLVDERAHGESEGHCLSLGVLERRDCIDWINYVRARFGADRAVTLFGVSMGAATVLMSAALGLPDNVTGIIADCGYSSPEAVIRRVCRDNRLPEGLMFHWLRFGGRLFGHFDLKSASAAGAMRVCRTPVLFIHGEADDFVPCDMSRENYAACAADKMLLTVPNAKHAMSYVVDRRSYMAAVDRFLEKTEGKKHDI